jgi:outer membrane protein assembly factor BamD (BamD/ComL family)
MLENKQGKVIKFGKYAVAFCFICFINFQLYSQQTLIYADPNATYNKAVILFDAQRYSQAAHLFKQVSHSIKDEQSSLKVNSDYYAAVCSMYLSHDDAESQMTGFIYKHPQSPEVHKIYFLLGN